MQKARGSNPLVSTTKHRIFEKCIGTAGNEETRDKKESKSKKDRIGQGNRSIRRMPWQQEATKGVASCEKPR